MIFICRTDGGARHGHGHGHGAALDGLTGEPPGRPSSVLLDKAEDVASVVVRDSL
jgi:hypothetical protein